jgi:hypothetical protein
MVLLQHSLTCSMITSFLIMMGELWPLGRPENIFILFHAPAHYFSVSEAAIG